MGYTSPNAVWCKISAPDPYVNGETQNTDENEDEDGEVDKLDICNSTD